jgi:hypothetical protein
MCCDCNKNGAAASSDVDDWQCAAVVLYCILQIADHINNNQSLLCNYNTDSIRSERTE